MGSALRAAMLCLTAMHSAVAAGSHGHRHSHAAAFGEPGKPAHVDRTIEIVMTDSRFDTRRIRVRPGETVRFVLHNSGSLVHEFNIGTSHMHDEHQAQMHELLQSGTLTPTDMRHDDAHTAHDHPNSILLEPGESGELIWRFGRAIESLQFACNVPGHYEAGMHGGFRFDS